MNLLKKMKNFNMQVTFSEYNQFLKFGIVGISNTLVGLMVYYILIYFNINYNIANTLGFIVSVFNAYYWNNRYVFKKERKKSNIEWIIKVFMSYGMTFILNTVLLFLMIICLHISSYIAPMINLFIITPINFLLNKYWAFK